MGDSSTPNPKKRARNPENALPSPPSRRKASSNPSLNQTIYISDETYSHHTNEAQNHANRAKETLGSAEPSLQLLDLPFELLTRILRHVGDIIPFERVSQSGNMHTDRTNTEIHRRNLLRARETCILLRDIADDPEVWSSTLLAQLSASTTPRLSSLTIQEPDKSYFRNTTTFCILLDAPKDSQFDFQQISSLLAFTTNIRHLQLIRRSSTYETFLKSPILEKLTPVECLAHEVILESNSIVNLESLVLVNVILRPSILLEYQRVCRSLRRIEIGWGTVDVTQNFDYNTRPLFRRQNESSLVSLSRDTEEEEPEPTKKSLMIPAPALKLPQTPFEFVAVLESFNQAVASSPVAQQKEDTAEEQKLTHLHLAGPIVLMLKANWISESLRNLTVDTSLLSNIPLVYNFNSALKKLPSCKYLASLSLKLGTSVAKSESIDVTQPLLALPELPHLLVLECDVPLEVKPSQLTRVVRGFPKLEILDLVFKNPAALALKLGESVVGVARGVVGGASVASTTVEQATAGKTSAVPVFPFSPLGILPKANLSVLFGSARQQRPAGQAEQITRDVRSEGARVGAGTPPPLSSPTTPPTTPLRPPPATVPNAALAHAAEVVVDGIMRSLSAHCSSLVTLCLSFDTKNASHTLHSIESEDWSSLTFPRLSDLTYNVGTLHSGAFGNAKTRFPRLRRLDISGCSLASPGALSTLHTSKGLSHLSLQGLELNPVSLSSFFETATAAKSLRYLDLRLAPPLGLDASLLQRIGHSCSRLTHLFISLARDTTIPMQTFTTLLKNCKKLKVLHLAERSSISTAVTDMIQRRGVQVCFS